jgi:hypothetical protein
VACCLDGTAHGGEVCAFATVGKWATLFAEPLHPWTPVTILEGLVATVVGNFSALFVADLDRISLN